MKKVGSHLALIANKKQKVNKLCDATQAPVSNKLAVIALGYVYGKSKSCAPMRLLWLRLATLI